VRIEIERVGLSPAEAGTIRACFEVMLAAERVDHPGEPWCATTRSRRGTTTPAS